MKAGNLFLVNCKHCQETKSQLTNSIDIKYLFFSLTNIYKNEQVIQIQVYYKNNY